jgi:hypothetical protein
MQMCPPRNDWCREMRSGRLGKGEDLAAVLCQGLKGQWPTRLHTIRSAKFDGPFLVRMRLTATDNG